MLGWEIVHKQGTVTTLVRPDGMLGREARRGERVESLASAAPPCSGPARLDVDVGQEIVHRQGAMIAQHQGGGLGGLLASGHQITT